MKNISPVETYTLVLVGLPEIAPTRYSLEETAELAGVHPEMLRYYCRCGLLMAAPAPTERDPVFDDDALCELRSFEYYRRHHGLDRQTLRLIGGLRRDVERLEAEVRFLRGL